MKTQTKARFAAAKYVFLDRDGVINRKPPEGEYITQWSEVELLPGAVEAIAKLNRAGKKVIVATNQRGIALGLMSEADLYAIHDQLRGALAADGAKLDAIYFCPHDKDTCDCRKPFTGMIEAAFRDFAGATPENSIFIGDSLSDIKCGKRAGMATILIEGDVARRKDGWASAARMADEVALSLSDAVDMLIG